MTSVHLLYSRKQDYPIAAFEERQAGERAVGRMDRLAHNMYYLRTVSVR